MRIIRMKPPKVAFSGGLLFIFSSFAATPASADFIMNAFSGDQFGDSYSYLFTISDSSDPDVFLGALTNTSPDDGFGDEPLIDLLAFNTTGIFGVDFTIQNVSPAWDVSPGPPSTDFDVVLSRVDPGDRLGFGDVLTFEIAALFPGAINFNTFLLAEIDDGSGIGGGDDEGQKAVSFQQLGDGGGNSDLLASNWDPPNVIVETPEPSALVLLGSGLLGFASLLRRRQQR